MRQNEYCRLQLKIDKWKTKYKWDVLDAKKELENLLDLTDIERTVNQAVQDGYLKSN